MLAVTLPPEAVWSVVDADEAESADATNVHTERVRTLSATLRQQLPIPGFPRASALLGEAYGRALRDERFAALVARSLLTIYLAQRASYITSDN